MPPASGPVIAASSASAAAGETRPAQVAEGFRERAPRARHARASFRALPGSIPIRGLFEAHLPVADLDRSLRFYRDALGLEVAFEVPDRGAAFLWCGAAGGSMLGLWSIGSMPMGMTLHVAFEVTLDDALAAPERLRATGIEPLSFFGEPADEPSAISLSMLAVRALSAFQAWM